MGHQTKTSYILLRDFWIGGKSNIQIYRLIIIINIKGFKIVQGKIYGIHLINNWRLDWFPGLSFN